ncbi:bifunctional DNA-formamidopyrimidine glycosylase/DNA-(apurinic or apyrimidinic site) lyase [Candidatus Methylospira mobilis]|uniref:Formamidopyrimidine-DNA glycosylase n=1 Tax=Candidatus Methylospira mobilis TaxID=1808979 RepID=A0A5Q0BKF0_9GAMM|nr:bifunctional DNA-formamidopyrimidine glycosylase/DNA-(apurinic or apyrimidinic site) lyase [Candidatus Methylospira mobilis]QFY44395.1 bifunctional DNA-formamidopyrimidine glycosylase/DNA-(apurinic or apyrimidinic site) lyase [Candidatus Methylospira mobilis]WNV06169.1 bifunctional DNA-formamidopyrimidine glycosylase/DNA-(apurinic or apyrimidinic site) lyase [Candidatus Methylospira mobilis]
MPELPEVETTRSGIAPHIEQQGIEQVVVRDTRLRWPVPAELAQLAQGRTVLAVTRRAKYLLLALDNGNLIIHLGMSGSLRITQSGLPPEKHDHIDIAFAGGKCLRFRDPRRFGCLLWSQQNPLMHPLLASLGQEPLDDCFSGEYLHQRAQGRSIPVKTYIMDQHIVVGVGNIYANEALFLTGLHPLVPAKAISPQHFRQLAAAIKSVLSLAIAQGGTTLRDFVNEAGKPGYFQQALNVYGRNGQACNRCGTTIRSLRISQRSSFFCPLCQNGR